MFKSILVPYDNSNPAASEASYAARLAKSTNEDCEIVLFHVVPSIPASPVFLGRPMSMKGDEYIQPSEYIDRLYQEMQNNAKVNLEKIKEEIQPEAGSKAKIRTVTAIGDSVSGNILDLAEKEKLDLIVIGNVGQSGLSKLKTLGSVSRAVSERSPFPAVIIH